MQCLMVLAGSEEIPGAVETMLSAVIPRMKDGDSAGGLGWLQNEVPPTRYWLQRVTNWVDFRGEVAAGEVLTSRSLKIYV